MHVFLLFTAALYSTAFGAVYHARGMTVQAFAWGAVALLLTAALFRAGLRSGS